MGTGQNNFKISFLLETTVCTCIEQSCEVDISVGNYTCICKSSILNIKVHKLRDIHCTCTNVCFNVHVCSIIDFRHFRNYWQNLYEN